MVHKGNLWNEKTIGIDATTLEGNAALKSIVRRDTEDSYQEFLMTLAKESGIETPTREALARFDRKRSKRDPMTIGSIRMIRMLESRR